MTEQELKEKNIIECLGKENEQCHRECNGECCDVKNGKCACKDAVIVSALEEIQQYRAIGTLEEIKLAQKYSVLAKKVGTIGKVIESCAEYEEIGTVEECQEAREKQIPKKPIRVPVGSNGSSTDGCPICKREFYEKFAFCPDCGQALDWGG